MGYEYNLDITNFNSQVTDTAHIEKMYTAAAVCAVEDIEEKRVLTIQ